MFFDNDERSRELAKYLIERKSTVRNTAAAFGISKSTVHKDITCRLRRIDFVLYSEVQKILECNKSERHIRGGYATKRKYELAKNTNITDEFVQ